MYLHEQMFLMGMPFITLSVLAFPFHIVLLFNVFKLLFLCSILVNVVVYCIPIYTRLGYVHSQY